MSEKLECVKCEKRITDKTYVIVEDFPSGRKMFFHYACFPKRSKKLENE